MKNLNGIINKEMRRALRQCGHKVLLEMYGEDKFREMYSKKEVDRCKACSGYASRRSCYIPLHKYRR